MLQADHLVSEQCRRSVVWVLVCLVMILAGEVQGEDADALLSLKSSIDPENLLPWNEDRKAELCSWMGVRLCAGGRVRKLVLEFQNLSGILDGKSLNELNELRVFSVKGNLLQGAIPDLSGLSNLKSLFLSENNFSGGFPESIATLHRLKVVVLSGNSLTGPIPESTLKLRRLLVFYINDNRFTGSIPPFNQTSLAFLNVSNNNLSGEIPITFPLSRFNESSFSGNVDLCGKQVGIQCGLAPSSEPSDGVIVIHRGKEKSKKWVPILAGSVGGLLLAMILLGLVLLILQARRQKRNQGVREKSLEKVEDEAAAGNEGVSSIAAGEGRGFSWDRDGLGALVFIGGETQMGYTLEDLLKASAETLGRGIIGSTYKAVLESGFIVTVKRLKDASYPGLEEFRTYMSLLGRLRHPNLVPLRAYFQAKEERLLVYDYFPNGSLYSLLHGTRTSNGGKPLHWTSCLKIAEDLASGLSCIHQTSGLIHGNLKSSNVLLGAEFESCITDYGLIMLQNPDVTEEPSSTSLFYRAPEIRNTRKQATQQSDIYSFGVLLLELLTGKTPYQDLVQEHGSDIPKWVRYVREEEIDSGDEPSSGNEGGEEKLQALVNIAMVCISHAPESRPSISDVLKMIREARGENHVSSNSSDHSPGRWSDTIQSFPREDQLSM